MNIYFEITDCMVLEFGHKYLVKYDANKDVHYLRVTGAAERIWCEDASEIVFIKHRYLDVFQTKVDLAEFMWVKLKSVPITGPKSP